MKFNLSTQIALGKTLAILTLVHIGNIAFPSATQAQATLINGGFEIPDIGDTATVSQQNPANVPGWQTTDQSIEIWANGFNGVFAEEGTQFAEINAFISGTLFQEVSGIAAGSEVGFTFLHRGRAGVDVMNLAITDLGLDNLFGTADDTILFSSNYSADNTAWVRNTNEGEDPIISLGNDVRFAYSAVSTATGNPSVGNFLDDANFGVGIGATPPPSVPEPATIIGILAFSRLSLGLKRKN